MTRWKSARSSVLAVVAWWGLASAALAQSTTTPRENAPAIINIMPPGATRGQVSEWTVVGRNLKAVDQWWISGGGVAVVEATATGEASATLKVKVEPTAEPGFREVRAVGAGGVSNLALVRIDTLDQVAEHEPNDAIDQPTLIPRGSAAWGVLKAQDLDYFRFEGKAGERLTIDLEAQRLGSPVVPVLTLMTATGSALAQARETRGLEHDARIAATLRADGVYVVQVRDTLYEGGDAAAYRLRVSGEPFATGVDPIGGPPGATITVAALGGNLDAPRSKTITLPDFPGALVDPGPFEGLDGPALVPMKLLVGSGPEVVHSPDDSNAPVRFSPGSTASGRISRPGEVDRYLIAARKGEILSVRVRASEMGSWLDSVVTIRDASGAVLVENDDPAGSAPQRNAFVVNQTQAPPDSRFVYEVRGDGDLTIEVADRYNEGGPAYGYRLEVGPARPEFAISFLFNDPTMNRRNLRISNYQSSRPAGVGQVGALNLRPGSSIPINFLVTAEGATGPIEVHAEGLPPGVIASTQTIRVPATVGRPMVTNRVNPPSGGAITLRVDAGTAAAWGELRLVATAKPEGMPPLVRNASAAVAIDVPFAGSVASRPVLRTLDRLPVRILGPSAAGSQTSSAPPAAPPVVAFQSITVPGVLLQGDRIDLTLGVDPPTIFARKVKLEATVSGPGVAAQTSIDPETGHAVPQVVRIIATPNAAPGVRDVAVTITPEGGTPQLGTASVIIRPPIRFYTDKTVAVGADQPGILRVSIHREPGFEGPVELRIDPPRSVRVVGRPVIPAGATVAEVGLEPTTIPDQGREIRVAGIARMPRGPVRVESALRPMLVNLSAEKND